MKQLILIVMLLIISISCYAQESQESYTLLMLEFENRTGIENPLLEMFNDTMAFVLSRQTGPVQVRMVHTTDRNALLARAAKMQPDATPLEQGLLVAEWVDADALITGSYTKQGEQWSLESQVHHRREGGRMRQDIQIQGDNFYKLLDEFPAQLFQQFAASYVALTTDSWKAYEEYRKGHEAFDNYNFFGALQHYDKALELDPTLALAYAEQSYAYFMTGRPEQATKAIEAAKQWLPKASPMEQLAIRILDYVWNVEEHGVIQRALNIALGGVWDEVLIHQLAADAYTQEGKQSEADLHNQQWFEAIQLRIRAHPDDASLLHSTAERCLSIERYVDEAIDMELRAIVELNLEEPSWHPPQYVLSGLYALKGDMQQALKWAGQSIQHLPDYRPDVEGTVDYEQLWFYLTTWLHERKIPPERFVRWCEDVLRIPGLLGPYRVRISYLMADACNVMSDTARVDAILTSIGASHESDWMVIGPFDASMESPFPEIPPFALCVNVEEPHVGVTNREVQWEHWEDENSLDGLLEIGPLFNRRYYDVGGPNIHGAGVVYSCIYVEVPTAVEAQVHTGSALMRIWLGDNPSPMIQVNTVRYPRLDTGLGNLSLTAGLNRFLVATAAGTYGFSFCFRITDHDGNPIPGLKYVSLREVLASH